MGTQGLVERDGNTGFSGRGEGTQGLVERGGNTGFSGEGWEHRV